MAFKLFDKSKLKYHKSDIILADGYYSNIKKNTLIFSERKGDLYESFIFPNILQANSNYIIIDHNKNIFNTCGDFLEKNGYTVKHFDIDHFSEFYYNPFDYFYDMDSIEDFCTALTIGEIYSDPFFNKLQSDLLAFMFSYFKYLRNANEHNLENVIRILNKSLDADDTCYFLRIMIDKAIEKDTNGVIARFGRNSILGNYIDDDSCLPMVRSLIMDCGMLLSRLSNNGDLSDDSKAKPLFSFTNKKEALFMELPDCKQNYGIYNALLFHLCKHLANNSRKFLPNNLYECLDYAYTETPIHFIIDDFKFINKMPRIVNTFLDLNLNNVFFSICIQDITEHNRWNATSYTNLINFSNNIFFSLEDYMIVKKKSSALQLINSMQCIIQVDDKDIIVPRFDFTKHPKYKLLSYIPIAI